MIILDILRKWQEQLVFIYEAEKKKKDLVFSTMIGLVSLVLLVASVFLIKKGFNTPTLMGEWKVFFMFSQFVLSSIIVYSIYKIVIFNVWLNKLVNIYYSDAIKYKLLIVLSKELDKKANHEPFYKIINSKYSYNAIKRLSIHNKVDNRFKYLACVNSMINQYFKANEISKDA